MLSALKLNSNGYVQALKRDRGKKQKARLERYQQMEAQARSIKKLDFADIQIPVGPRLGSKVLVAEHIHKASGDRVLIDDLSFTLPRNGIVGVIGPNGVGKSTLFKTIVGLEDLTSGSLEIGESVKISYVDQNREGIDPKKNVWEAVSDGLDYMKVGETPKSRVAPTLQALALRVLHQQKPCRSSFWRRTKSPCNFGTHLKDKAETFCS